MEATTLADYVLWGILIGTAYGVLASRSLLKSLVYLTIFSLISAGLYLMMEAPDVAMTEAAIGSAISMLFFLAAFRIVGREEASNRRFVFVATILMSAIFFFLMTSVVDLPLYGDPNSPASLYVADYYNQNAKAEIGVGNTVTAVLADYRGYDTLGEVYVILTAAISVLLILPVVMWRNA